LSLVANGQVIAGQLEPDLADLIGWPHPDQDRLGLGRAQLPAHSARGQLGQQPVQPAHRLGAQPPEFLAAIAQQPQADQRIITGDLGDAGAVQGGQPDRDGVIPVAEQTSLEPLPRRPATAGRRPFVSQSTPHRGRRQPIRERARPARRQRITDPPAPHKDLNKLPTRRGE